MKQSTVIPAAEYVRMSTEEQRYSIANQRHAIAEYARNHGFEIIRSYEDAGESGLSLKDRRGLRDLLADVLTGKAVYKKIIVLDVSRWGRFLDADEAAHYEFVCRNAGINVLYCAEEFDNEGTEIDYLAKVLKRTAAAEYSRELSIKNFENHKFYVQLGYHVGGQSGYGFRRMSVSADGVPKRILLPGETKEIMSDRVTLVHGPEEEVRCVRMIFDMGSRGNGCTAIARHLNRLGIKNAGRTWKNWMIDEIAANPKYTGTYVWNRKTQRLQSASRMNDREEWVVNPKAYPPMVSKEIFDKAQVRMRATNGWTEEALLKKLKHLLAKRGDISEHLIRQTRNMPSVATLWKRLGPFKEIYKRLGFSPVGRFVRATSRNCTLAMRNEIFRQIGELYGERAQEFRISGKIRRLLLLDGQIISVVLCRSRQRPGREMSWYFIPAPQESRYMTLVCNLNQTNNSFHSFHLFSSIRAAKPIRFTGEHPWLRGSLRVNRLAELPTIAAALKLLPDRG